MIMPSDKEYKETKQIMLGKKVMKPEFIELAEWIDETYEVKTINIIYDTFVSARKKQSRLQICFEFESESLKFQDGPLGNFHETKQTAIAQKFREILRTEKSANSGKLINIFRTPKYITNNILIVFSAFEPIAKIEANESVPDSRVKALKHELDNKDIWEISRAFGGTTIFLYTDEQSKNTRIPQNIKNGRTSILIYSVSTMYSGISNGKSFRSTWTARKTLTIITRVIGTIITNEKIKNGTQQHLYAMPFGTLRIAKLGGNL